MQYINGLWVEEGTHCFTSINPATGETLWQGWAAGEAQVIAAVSAARAAFPTWSATSYLERLAILQQFKTLVEHDKEALAIAISKETGKALWDSRSEVAATLGKLAFAQEAYEERTGTKSRPMPGGAAVVRHRPHGVMAVYGPYNFPAHLPNGHIIPALMAGNTVVFKPSEQTPLVGEWMVRKWEQAGLPPGVLSLLQGEKETGIALSISDVNGILFTGSTATGKAIHRQLAGRPDMMLALEMGGNNALIVNEISNIKAAVHETVLSAFTSTGQRCTCARRVIVVEWDKASEFIDQFVESAAALQMGGYDSQPEPFMGPVISNIEAKRLLEAQQNLENLGGKPLLRMRQLTPELPFLSSAIIDMTGVDGAPDTEYFGPLVQLYRVPTPEAAIALANATAFGLSAAVFTDSAALYQQVSRELHAGLVNWNRQTTGASGAAPFGGVGISGNHRPAGYYSADYCSYPVASVEIETLAVPAIMPPGMKE